MIVSIENLETCDMETIKHESLKEGYNMINRLIIDYHSGENRFDKEGEKLIGFTLDSEIVAVCGLNIESTYNRLGRIRRLYVLKDYRHQQIATMLVEYLVEYAKQYFKGVVVNIGDLPVDNFYKSAGFSPVNNKSYTHIYNLDTDS
ncbi:GNAT family N-acetyltransferase [Chloroflexota bacterium]